MRRALVLLVLQGYAWADLPEPTLHWSFDEGMEVDVVAAGARPEVTGEVQFVPGRKGQALFVPEGATVALPTRGHIDPRQGTVALWVKPQPPEGRPKYARLFDITGATDPPTTVRLLHPSHTLLYAEMSTGGRKYIPWPMGDATVRGEGWQHMAITWGPEGGAFYMNGVTLTSTASMPELSGVPGKLYVGSEGDGVYPACAPIDELYVFDQALRSHELFELAGREPAADLGAGNWIENSSFETGVRPWATSLWAARDSEIRVADDVGYSGQHSLLMDRSRETHDWWSTTWVMGPWVHLQRHETVTLSAWVRADRPGVQVSMDIQRGTEGRAVQGVPAEATLLSHHRAGTQWQRLVLTGLLPISYKDGYRPRIYVTSRPCKVWIDDVQMALGPEREYVPKDAFEIGLCSAEKTATYDLGQTAQPVLRWSNLGAARAAGEVVVTVTGPGERAIGEQRVAASAGPGESRQLALAPIRTDRPGHYEVTARLGDHHAKLTLAAMRSHLDTPSPGTSPFGAHGGGDEAARFAGLSHYRDVSGLTWRWIERADGDWRYDGREPDYARKVALGFSNCGTIADAPPWASEGNGDLVPDSVDRWRGYVRKIIADFAPHVDIWEVWNEPDLKGTFAQDVQRYVDLLKAVREEQAGADPDSQLAGLCAAGTEERAFGWMEDAMRLGALEQMDLLAWHPYYHDRPEDGYYQAMVRVNELMDKYGGRKPMIFTEFGCAGVSDPSLHIPWAADGWRRYDERGQAAVLVRQCVMGLGAGAVKLYWYQWNEERIQTGPDTFGLVRADTYSTPKLALVAYSQMIRSLENASLPPAKLQMPAEGQWGYEFGLGEGTVKVLWDAEGESELPWPEGSRVYDLWGNEVGVQAALRLSGEPVYVAVRE